MSRSYDVTTIEDILKTLEADDAIRVPDWNLVHMSLMDHDWFKGLDTVIEEVIEL